MNAIDHPLGVFQGKSNAEYHGGPGISKSGLDVVSKSPAHYKQSRADGYTAPTPSQRLGTLAHSFILENDTFWDHYALPFEAPEGALDTVAQIKDQLKELGEKVAASAKKADLIEQLRAVDPEAVFLDDAKAAYADEVGDREIITAKELEDLEGMRASIMRHPKASKLLEAGSGVAELSCYWRDEETGALCRCRPDFWRHDGIIVDLKTSRDACYDGFQKSISGWRYDTQDPYYLDGATAAVTQGENPLKMPAPRAFIFVAIEPFAPYACSVFVLDPESREIGRSGYRKALNRYAECLRTGEWPAYSDKIETISLPEWRLRQEAYEQDEQGVYSE
ncbi:hypothetical protein BMI91_19495 [Thioclava sediminum]|uniref:Putative exodeoxyribonuclease 8 PDDEXK-like domain-containing protein n=1 Tax=Thioclava sediminum TaxID=1915319 RepID=A0ABX3MRZ5_9RHOB|nr:PD-(D/E)XK nuclease-like domain-containing protein [Thioclava sediminum]OOY22468.1 hypothetical protein BMI91_19495 [Thioclava sediminum]